MSEDLIFFLKTYFWCFCLYYDRTVCIQKAKQERERGGRDCIKSMSRDSNSGHTKCNDAICRHADILVDLDVRRQRDGLFTGGSIIMDYGLVFGQKRQFKFKMFH